MTQAFIVWLVVSTPLKNISQLGLLFPIYGKIKKMFQTTNQLFRWGSHFLMFIDVDIQRKTLANYDGDIWICLKMDDYICLSVCKPYEYDRYIYHKPHLTPL
jgi:hypothetical protein